jgi:hypothetical protein
MNRVIFLTNELIFSNSLGQAFEDNWVNQASGCGIEDVYKFVGATCLGYSHFPQYVRKLRMEISI